VLGHSFDLAVFMGEKPDNQIGLAIVYARQNHGSLLLSSHFHEKHHPRVDTRVNPAKSLLPNLE
jgi:hypothetical protein